MHRYSRTWVCYCQQLRGINKKDHPLTPRKMTLTHEHLLACERCNSPLFISRLDGSSPSSQSAARTRLILTYEQTVSDILEGQAAIPSFLCDMREDTTDPQHHMAPSLTSIHVLNMEGFEKPNTRRDFANHCALDSGILEGQFVTLSRLVGADVGVCWCECHARQDHLKELEDAHAQDDCRPLIPAPVVEIETQRDVGAFADSQHKADQSMRRKKRKRWSLTEARRWPLLIRPHHGKETDALSILE